MCQIKLFLLLKYVHQTLICTNHEQCLSDYSFGLSTTTEYSCLSVYLCVCVCFCVSMRVSVYTITKKNNDSIHLKLEQIVKYENSLDEFDFGHCLIKVKVTVRL